MFLTSLLSVKCPDGSYFSFSCYDGKRSSLMHLFVESRVLFEEYKKKQFSEMLVGLEKSTAKEN